MREETVIRKAEFDTKIRWYWFFQGCWLLLLTMIGIPLLPFWLLGLGQIYSAKAFERLECELTTRSLHIRKGLIYRVERTIPLDKIQDLALHEGPILRALGLTTIRIETAGQSGAQGGSDASLVGVVNAMAFRDAVLQERDRVTEKTPEVSAATPSAGGELAVLEEIRDSLGRIEVLLQNRSSG